MGQILKFPVQAAKFGYKRVRKRARAEDPNQLHLFAPTTAQILNLTPETGWFEQALMLDERGDPTAAEFYAKAIAEQDCVADACCNLGIIESRNGHTAKAVDCFTASLKHNPRHVEAHYNLGNLYFDANDLRLARIHYEIATELDPCFANVYFNLALVQAMHRDLAAAVDTLTRYQELVPDCERRNADELLHNLKRSLEAANGFQFDNTGVN
jgi:tetratricopeptide (TPR) repeat protein